MSTSGERTLTGGVLEHITIEADFTEGGFTVDSLTARRLNPLYSNSLFPD